MDLLKNQISHNDNLFEDTFSENITFSQKFTENCDFTDTLAFVKGFSTTWDNLSSSISQKSKHNQSSQRISLSTADNIKNISINSNLQNETRDNHKELPKNDLKSWGLPPQIIDKYDKKGIKQMFPWQVECLSNTEILHSAKNLIYSAPTSAGKTLVAETLMLKCLLEKRKKALVILPFVSVVREKTFYFQEILSDSGIRVEGFMGTNMPAGGYQAVHVAVCTIEKANSLVNHMLEDDNLSNLGIVVVDELHLLGDPHRGYILELLLTKILYMTKKNEDIQIQIVGMSATLPNLSALSDWLTAQLYRTDFRPIPLQEYCLIEDKILDSGFECVRKILPDNSLPNDKDHIINLTLETLYDNCSILIFCPTKNWCENLAQQISLAFQNIGYGNSQHSQNLRKQLNPELIKEVIEQLSLSPVGLDPILCNTISFGVAFHHAGLTMDERDIIESAFKRSAIRVLIATSTLSSGVNLPARRVIIRSATFHSKPINIMTYKQMIGRAGRMGIDSAGESILIVNDRNTAHKLIDGGFEPIASCLEGEDRLMRAILESIASEITSTYEDIILFAESTLLFSSSTSRDNLKNIIDNDLKELLDYELIRIHEDTYIATALGKACLSSSMSPRDGLTLFKELQKARECFVLETDLHMIYLVTPYSICQQWGEINWIHFLKIWDSLSKSMKRVGELVGIQESLIYRFMNKSVKLSGQSVQKKIEVCKRFYTALALQDLVNEVPLSTVANNFSCSRGMLQSLQQSAATFAGMVTAFSRKLGWKSFELLVFQFQDRLHFGIHGELIELMKLQSLNSVRARALYDADIQNLCTLAKADIINVEKALYSAFPFESEKERDGDIQYDVQKRNKEKNIWLTGKKGISVNEAAKIIVEEARTFLQLDMGIKEIDWNLQSKCDVVTSEDTQIPKENLNSPFPTSDENISKTNLLPDIENVGNFIEITSSDKLSSDLNCFDSSGQSESIFEDSLTIDTQLNGMLNGSLSKEESLFFDTTLDKDPMSFTLKSAFKESFNTENNSNVFKIPEITNSSKRKASDIFSDDVSPSPMKQQKNTSTEIFDTSGDSFSLEFTKRFLFDDSDFQSVEIPDHLKNKLFDSPESSYKYLNFIKACDSRNIFDKCIIYLENCDILSVSIQMGWAPENGIGSNVVNTKVEGRENINYINSDTDIYVKNINICTPDGFIFLFYLQNTFHYEIKPNEAMLFLRKLLSDQNKTVIINSIKEMYQTLWKCCGIKLTYCEDPLVADWYLDPESKSGFFERYFDVKVVDIIKFIRLTWTPDEDYSSSWITLLTMNKLKSLINIKGFGKIETFVKEMKILPILAESEMNGIAIDQRMATCTSSLYDIKSLLQRKAIKLAGIFFTISSRTEVAKVLGLNKGRRIDTNKRILEKMENPLAQTIMYWRKLHSIAIKTLHPISREVIKKRLTTRMYPSYSTNTLTGRITMLDPNLQSVPRNFEVPSEFLSLDDANIENTEQVKLRNIFIAENGNVLISADYCQLELRLLAHFSKDEVLLNVLSGSKDVFKSIAAKWKCIQEEDVDDDMRQEVKQLCYGIIYGMGDRSLAQLLDITELEANVFMHTFYSAYPKIKPFIKSVIESCQKTGFVETLSKRRRYLPKINSKKKAERSHAERQAVNSTIQGSAADILKSCVISLNDRIKKSFQDSSIKLVLLLHDEVIFEVPEEKLDSFKTILTSCMENSEKLLVPLPVQVKIGKKWGELKSI